MATQRISVGADQRTVQALLLFALKGDGAHVDYETAVKDVPAAVRNRKPTRAAHTLWEVLEHLRIAQWDVLQAIKNPKHVAPDFPAGYWPQPGSAANAKEWQKSIDQYRADFGELLRIVAASDVTAPLHGVAEQSIARKLLMLADHNAYHIAEFVTVRRLLGAWLEG